LRFSLTLLTLERQATHPKSGHLIGAASPELPMMEMVRSGGNRPHQRVV
jgi:hypothetical protein